MAGPSDAPRATSALPTSQEAPLAKQSDCQVDAPQSAQEQARALRLSSSMTWSYDVLWKPRIPLPCLLGRCALEGLGLESLSQDSMPAPHPQLPGSCLSLAAGREDDEDEVPAGPGKASLPKLSVNGSSNPSSAMGLLRSPNPPSAWQCLHPHSQVPPWLPLRVRERAMYKNADATASQGCSCAKGQAQQAAKRLKVHLPLWVAEQRSRIWQEVLPSVVASQQVVVRV
eukprot:CAMPEP_0178370578 /NCGR_PEP_ID=MMETSP0689_2-20121128/381_1 /TAXON_ID=160604 /ORGANISM="Amphidinium massartii, Strain CS-259" /LENGTH=227 /DNA_ID=CAMNT_0019990417 /DNA_START=559 /DNA_END=1244 /DNA_ORIENTATION=+